MNRATCSGMIPRLGLVGAGLLGVAAVAAAQESHLTRDEAQQHRACVEILESALHLRSSFISVHAAEALVVLGRMEPAREAFLPQAETTEPKYRIGVWRVLARTAENETLREQFIERIRNVLQDPRAEDQGHAIETLAKLQVVLNGSTLESARQMAADQDAFAAPFALWSLANSGDPSAVSRLADSLESSSPVTRSQAAYALWQLHLVQDEIRQRILQQLAREPANSSVRAMFTAAIGGPQAAEQARSSATPAARYLAVMSLADTPLLLDEGLFTSLLQDADPDVRVAAAFAWCRKQALEPEAGESAKGTPETTESSNAGTASSSQ